MVGDGRIELLAQPPIFIFTCNGFTDHKREHPPYLLDNNFSYILIAIKFLKDFYKMELQFSKKA